MRAWMARRRSHSRSFGTSSEAPGALGFEMIPTVLMTGIEEELPIPFRARDGAFDDVGSEVHVAHGLLHFVAHRLMELGIAHDASLAYLGFAHLKLRFD